MYFLQPVRWGCTTWKETEHGATVSSEVGRVAVKEIYDPNRQGVVYESRRSLDYPLPRQALIQPFEATDRQNVWLELHPELWSDCVFPFNPACGKAAFAASLYFPLSIRFWEEGGKKKKRKINLKTCPNLTLHLSLPFLQSFFFFFPFTN